jgi:hypothetical protein
MDEYGYQSIHATISADTSFTFNLMSDCTNDYFSLPDGDTIDSNHGIAKVYLFNSDTGNYYQSRPELDLFHVYLHLDLCSCTANVYVCEMMTDKKTFYIKEYTLDSLKVSGIARNKKRVHILFISDDENGVTIWFRRLMLEHVMLYWIGIGNSFD